MTSYTIHPEHAIGDRVYLKTDPEQLGRIVTGIIVRKGSLLYLLSLGHMNESMHYGIEVSKSPDTLTKMGLQHSDQ